MQSKWMQGGPFPKFLAMHTCFLIFTGLPGVFINTFLMGRTDDNNVVLYYNGVFFLTGALCMLLAAYALHKLGPSVVSLIGILCYNALYLLLILLGDNAPSWFLLLGLVSGVADGFYWISYGHLLSSFTSAENRDKGLAAISIAGAVVNLVIPFLSGLVISKIGGTQGYVVIFLLAFIIALVTGVGALLLPKPPKTQGGVRYKETLRLILRDKRLGFALAGQGMKGVREGVFTFILSVLLYQLVRSEFLIGFSTLLSAAASIGAYALISRFVKPANRVRYMLISVAALFVWNVVSSCWLSPASVIMYSVLNAFCAGFLVNSSFTIYLDAMQAVPGALERRPELIAVNECALVLGRCIGIVGMVAINLATGGSVYGQMLGLLGITATQIITVLLCRKAAALLERATDV